MYIYEYKKKHITNIHDVYFVYSQYTTLETVSHMELGPDLPCSPVTKL